MKLVWLFLLFFPAIASALEPSEILVIANRSAPNSVDIAKYYMQKRGIPKENLLRIATTELEGCSRESYLEEIAEPVRKAVTKNEKIQALVTIYGVPLKIGRPKLRPDERSELNLLLEKSKEIQVDLKDLEESENKAKAKLKKELDSVSIQIRELRKYDYDAAVDSELALVLNHEYSLKLWIPNPYFVGNRGKTLTFSRDEVLMVSRLDGPSLQIVKQIIDDSLSAEQNGLVGKAYFDAKGPRAKNNKLNGYAYYDNSLHLAADRLKHLNRIPVVVNQKGELFQSGDAPDAALYCGWYSYQNYIDAFDWVPGAIGYHLSSVECHTLRSGDKRRFWCRSMLEDGAAAVIGPIGEPYLQSFPAPEIFFHYLSDGYYNLVESYFLSLPYLSWRMVLVGDPLYRPFKNVKIVNKSH